MARGDWRGTAAALLKQLSALAGHDITVQREWPKTPRALTAALKRLAPDLRTAGIEWQRLERTGSARLHSIRLTGDTTVTSVMTDTPSTDQGDGPTLNRHTERHSAISAVEADPSRPNGRDGRDGTGPPHVVADVDPASVAPPATADDVAEMPIEEDYPKSAWGDDANDDELQLDEWEMEPAVEPGGGDIP